MSGTLHPRRASAVPTAAALLHASRPRTTSSGACIVEGETALQLTQRHVAVSQARSFIAILGGSFFVKLDGPALSKYNTGRLFQVRFGNDPNKPMMVRVDYKAMSQGQDPRLHVNIQQQGKGSKGLSKHISIDPRDLAKSLGNKIKMVPVVRPPFVPVFNPRMLNPGLCADRWDTST